MGIEMPIVETVYSMLYEGLSATRALESLMLREPRPETWG
jgi:glycerol-3-phosphate dehydrogenase